MWVTIIADASFCPETGKAGYGFWIASSRGKLAGDGAMLVPKVKNNIAAEMMALLNAMQAGIKKEIILIGDNLLLQTDCQPAIDAFLRLRNNISKQELELVDWYDTFCSNHNLTIKFKHVKGHSNDPASRYVVNNICDRKAKRNMRRARDEFLIQQLGNNINE